jgi:glucan phosphoethanolaminetransferase (alkaline phosphatase superfamily)
LIAPGIVWASRNPGVETTLLGVLLPAVLLLVYFSFWGRLLWLGILILTPFAVLAVAESAFIATYGHPSDYSILATLGESNSREIRDFLGPILLPIAALFALAIVLTIATVWLAWKNNLSWRGRFRAYVLTIALLLPISIWLFAFLSTDSPNVQDRMHAGWIEFASYGETSSMVFPFGVPLRLYQYNEAWQAMLQESNALKSFHFDARSASNVPQRQVYVLVIGESARRDRWQLFGYDKPTTLELMQMQDLVPLSDMISTWNASRTAIPVLITRKSGTDPHPYFNESSLLKAFHEAGFTTFWLSNQMAIGSYDSPISAYAFEADVTRFFNPASWTDAGTLDEVLLPPLRDAIHSRAGNLFIVLHAMGNHGKYAYRYPPDFDRFHPSQTDGSTAPAEVQLANSYDNATAYTDHVLASIIAELKLADAVSALFYSSDHGEDLPTSDCHMSGHGNPTLYDFIVPAFFWYSDSYAKTFPEKISALHDNAHKRLTTEAVFESVIDMGNITFPTHDQTRSMLSTTLTERPRHVNTYGIVDFDHAQIGTKCRILMEP